MFEVWCDYIRPESTEKPKLCCMDTDSFIVCTKINGIYKNITKDVETRFENSNYELGRPLPKAKKKGYWFNER